MTSPLSENAPYRTLPILADMSTHWGFRTVAAVIHPGFIYAAQTLGAWLALVVVRWAVRKALL